MTRPLAESALLARRKDLSLPVSQGESFGLAEMGARRAEALDGSKRLLRAMLSYGVKHGLPNLSPVECQQRLRGL